MLRLLFVVCYSLPVLLMAQGTLKLTAGTSLHVGTAGVLTLDNMNLEIDGSLSTAPGSSVIRLTGNATTSILGTSPGPPLLDILQIEKTGGANILLQRNINIRTSINFTSGLLDLNGNILFLTTNAALIGESATSHITGNSGYVEASQLLNVPVSQNPGNLGAIISSSQDLGLVIVRRGHKSQTNAAGNGNSILRYYDILPASNTGLNATLRFNYLTDELNGLSENGLVFWKTTNGAVWTNEGFTSRDAGLNYVEKTGIDGFSRWTLSSPGNPLPVEFIFFNTHCENGKVLLTWKTAQELNSSYFNIEKSANGSAWSVIGTVASAGNSFVEQTYQYTDNSNTGNNLYRIAQYDLDGKTRYSIIVHSSCDGNEAIKLWPNPAQTTTWLSISASARIPIQIRLYDSKGALVHQQMAMLATGSNQVAIPLYRLAKGTYTVVTDFMNGELKATKLVRN
jgi:hypothetical protein